MADKCACCGKKIGFLDYDFLESKGNKYMICGRCKYNINSCIEGNQIIDSVITSDTDQGIIVYLKDNMPKEDTEKQIEEKMIAEHMLTTGYSFEGYNIVRYNGLVSGERVFGTGFISDLCADVADFFGGQTQRYSSTLKQIKQVALNDMIKDSLSKGGNAIIGISYKFVTFTGNMVGLSANGTSVTIEKIDEEK